MRWTSQLTIAVLLCAVAAHADVDGILDWPEGGWRLELSALTAAGSSDEPDRGGDRAFAVVFDYEVPFDSDRGFLEHSTFSFRLRPFMYYRQDDFEPDDIFIAGSGIAYRVYRHADTHTGFFGEIAGEVILQSDKFEGNSTQFNFLPQVAVGYQSETGWFLSARYEHASNAGLGDHNHGVNMIGVSAGLRF